eukprot:GHVN01002168.1.p1 GENE.GHVN01002168.1~~GHVN01002168.1.p1  ORF type:complete len:961 (+),score=109.81 GHVN01002168.1:206-3088(+)
MKPQTSAPTTWQDPLKKKGSGETPNGKVGSRGSDEKNCITIEDVPVRVTIGRRNSQEKRNSGSGSHLASPHSPTTQKDPPTNSDEWRPTARLAIHDTKIIVNYLPPCANEGDLKALFVQAGEVVRVALVKGKDDSSHFGFGFVTFASREGAKRAVEMFEGYAWGEKKLKVSPSRPQSEKIKGANLYVRNIPPSYTEVQVYDLFSPYGGIIHVKILGEPTKADVRRSGFIRYDKRSQAVEAVNKLDGKMIEGSREPLSVTFANPKKADASKTKQSSASDTSDIAKTAFQQNLSRLLSDSPRWPMSLPSSNLVSPPPMYTHPNFPLPSSSVPPLVASQLGSMFGVGEPKKPPPYDFAPDSNKVSELQSKGQRPGGIENGNSLVAVPMTQDFLDTFNSFANPAPRVPPYANRESMMLYPITHDVLERSQYTNILTKLTSNIPTPQPSGVDIEKDNSIANSDSGFDIGSSRVGSASRSERGSGSDMSPLASPAGSSVGSPYHDLDRGGAQGSRSRVNGGSPYGSFSDCSANIPPSNSAYPKWAPEQMGGSQVRIAQEADSQKLQSLDMDKPILPSTSNWLDNPVLPSANVNLQFPLISGEMFQNAARYPFEQQDPETQRQLQLRQLEMQMQLKLEQATAEQQSNFLHQPPRFAEQQGLMLGTNTQPGDDQFPPPFSASEPQSQHSPNPQRTATPSKPICSACHPPLTDGGFWEAQCNHMCSKCQEPVREGGSQKCTACYREEMGGNSSHLERQRLGEDRITSKSLQDELNGDAGNEIETDADDHSITIFVHNFGREKDDRHILRLFGEHARVLGVDIIKNPRTGRHKGYAFIKVANQAGASRLIDKFDGYEWEGRTIGVEWKKKPKPAPAPVRAPQQPVSQAAQVSGTQGAFQLHFNYSQAMAFYNWFQPSHHPMVYAPVPSIGNGGNKNYVRLHEGVQTMVGGHQASNTMAACEGNSHSPYRF